MPDGKVVRAALTRWGFNTNQRQDLNQPENIATAVRWIERNTLPVPAWLSRKSCGPCSTVSHCN
jgi:hypothetical protein